MEFWNSQLNALNANIIGENQDDENHLLVFSYDENKTLSEVQTQEEYDEAVADDADLMAPTLCQPLPSSADSLFLL